MSIYNKQVAWLWLHILLLVGLIIASCVIMGVYFTAVDYTTHSAILEYVDFNLREECIKYSLTYLFYGGIAVFLTSSKYCYQPFRIGASILLLFIHFFYFIFSVLGSMDVSDIYVKIMGLISLIVNIGVIVVSLIAVVRGIVFYTSRSR